MTRLRDLSFLLAGIVGLASLVVIVPLVGLVDGARWVRAEWSRWVTG